MEPMVLYIPHNSTLAIRLVLRNASAIASRKAFRRFSAVQGAAERASPLAQRAVLASAFGSAPTAVKGLALPPDLK